MKTLIEVFDVFSPGRQYGHEAQLISDILDDLSPEDQVDRIRAYAREVAQDALNRAAENAKSYGMAQTDQNRIVYPGVIKESITETEIILP